MGLETTMLREDLGGPRRRHHHEGNPTQSGMLFQLIADRIAIYTRQLDAQQDEFRNKLCRHVDRRLAIHENKNRRALRLEGRLDLSRKRLVCFNNHDPRHAHLILTLRQGGANTTFPNTTFPNTTFPEERCLNGSPRNKNFRSFGIVGRDGDACQFRQRQNPRELGTGSSRTSHRRRGRIPQDALIPYPK